MLWGCICNEGVGPLILISSNLTASGYCQLLENNFIPRFSNLPSDHIFQEDNAPIHSAKLSTNWRLEHQIQKIDWPAQNLDLNLIENL